MKHLGIDLHSNNFTYCQLKEDSKKVKGRFDLTNEDLEKFYKMLDTDTCVMIEASTNTFQFVELIKDKVHTVFVANTHKLKLISLVKKKTDKVDAEKLAIFLKMQITSGEEIIKPVYIPEETIQQLRSLFTTYRLIRKQIGQLKNRIHSIFKQNLHPFTKEYIFGKNNRKVIRNLINKDIEDFQINFLFDRIEEFENGIEEVEKKIMIIGFRYYQEIEILTSMKGISVMTAIAIMADIAKIERFPNSKHFTSYLRSAPGVDKSNETERITSTNKFGRKLSVTLISQSLNHFRDGSPVQKRWYEKKIESNKKGKIRMALCRRVFSEIFQMLKKKEYHYYRDEKNHLKKMAEYDKFLLENGIILKNCA